MSVFLLIFLLGLPSEVFANNFQLQNPIEYPDAGNLTGYNVKELQNMLRDKNQNASIQQNYQGALKTTQVELDAARRELDNCSAIKEGSALTAQGTKVSTKHDGYQKFGKDVGQTVFSTGGYGLAKKLEANKMAKAAATTLEGYANRTKDRYGISFSGEKNKDGIYTIINFTKEKSYCEGEILKATAKAPKENHPVLERLAQDKCEEKQDRQIEKYQKEISKANEDLVASGWIGQAATGLLATAAAGLTNIVLPEEQAKDNEKFANKAADIKYQQCHALASAKVARLEQEKKDAPTKYMSQLKQQQFFNSVEDELVRRAEEEAENATSSKLPQVAVSNNNLPQDGLDSDSSLAGSPGEEQAAAGGGGGGGGGAGGGAKAPKWSLGGGVPANVTAGLPGQPDKLKYESNQAAAASGEEGDGDFFDSSFLDEEEKQIQLASEEELQRLNEANNRIPASQSQHIHGLQDSLQRMRLVIVNNAAVLMENVPFSFAKKSKELQRNQDSSDEE